MSGSGDEASDAMSVLANAASDGTQGDIAAAVANKDGASDSQPTTSDQAPAASTPTNSAQTPESSTPVAEASTPTDSQIPVPTPEGTDEAAATAAESLPPPTVYSYIYKPTLKSLYLKAVKTSTTKSTAQSSAAMTTTTSTSTKTTPTPTKSASADSDNDDDQDQDEDDQDEDADGTPTTTTTSAVASKSSASSSADDDDDDTDAGENLDNEEEEEKRGGSSSDDEEEDEDSTDQDEGYQSGSSARAVAYEADDVTDDEDNDKSPRRLPGSIKRKKKGGKSKSSKGKNKHKGKGRKKYKGKGKGKHRHKHRPSSDDDDEDDEGYEDDDDLYRSYRSSRKHRKPKHKSYRLDKRATATDDDDDDDDDEAEDAADAADASEDEEEATPNDLAPSSQPVGKFDWEKTNLNTLESDIQSYLDSLSGQSIKGINAPPVTKNNPDIVPDFSKWAGYQALNELYRSPDNESLLDDGKELLLEENQYLIDPTILKARVCMQDGTGQLYIDQEAETPVNCGENYTEQNLFGDFALVGKKVAPAKNDSSSKPNTSTAPVHAPDGLLLTGLALLVVFKAFRNLI